ncbi:hydroxyproline-rich glycoprotein family protein [Euphorbia peplus]|nr:hydroxyproline-rich glycoprotein family protein [Euphorbia peplus]
MVERRQPSTSTIDGGDNDPPQVPSQEIDEHVYDSTINEQETYIIQIPKEQIFSNPPLKNSIIAKRYRKPEKKGRRKCKRISFGIATIIVVIVVVGIIFGTIHALSKAKVPSFSIHNVDINHNNYVIKLKAKNENKNFENIYGNNGDAILLYKGHKIGRGKFPEFHQDADSSVDFKLRLTGYSNGGLSKDIKGKRHVDLRLEMNNVHAKMNVWNKVINVVCNFKVSSLGTFHHNIISQQCESNFQ